MPALKLPFAHLNLRRNPFGELPLDQWAEAVVPDFDADQLAGLVGRLRSGAFGQGLVMQFLGHRGRGKTSHLMALRRYLPEAPYRHFPEDGPAPNSLAAVFDPPNFAAAPVLFLDETQRIPRRIRRALFRHVREHGHSLVIGTHKNHRRQIRAAGLELLAHDVRGLAPRKLLAICERRFALAARRPPPAAVPRLGRAAAEALIERHGDNLRAILSDLYDVVQGLDQICVMGPESFKNPLIDSLFSVF